MSTAAKPRQLNLDELQRLKWLLGGVTALVALWTVFFLDIEALGLVAVASLAVLAVLIWPGLPGRMPALVWKLAVPAIIVALAADFYLSPDTLPVLIRLAILLVLYRALGYRRRREDLQLLVLGLFLIVVAGVLTVAVEFAFMLLLFTACALGFLFVVNLIEASATGAVRTPEAETAWTRLGWRPFFGRLRAVADWRMIAFASALFTAVVVMSGVLFLVIPRFELASGFFLDRYITRKSRSGFTDTVKFGDVTELIKDDSVAMRVDLTDVGKLRGDPYWRLVVLDEYLPEGFRLSARLKAHLLTSQRSTQVVRGRMNPVRRSETSGGFWTVYMEPGVSRYLPLPGSFGTLRLRDASQVQTTIPQERARSDRQDSIDGFNIVALRTEAMAMTAFQLDNVVMAESWPDPQFGRHLRGWLQGGENVRDERNYFAPIMLKGPEGPANTATLTRLVQEITGGRQLSAGEFARSATAWIRKRHAYSLSVKIPPKDGRDDIVRWLDSNEPGFCEYFAAGFTVLARAAGYPTRVVAGFHGGALNGFENYYMVKNSNAHAWVEIYDGATAWIRVDPTPGGGAAAAQDDAADAARGQDSSWSARMDSLRVLWYRRIVNFDSRQQVQMIDQVKTFTTGTGAALKARLDAWSRQVKEWLARPWDWKRVLRSGGLILGVAALGWMIWRLAGSGWQRWRQWRRPAEFDPVRRTAGRWLSRIAESGVRTAECLAVREELRRLRYGPRESWPEPRGVFKRAGRARKLAGRRT
ncbi:MAG TPA: DUF3488 and transglutaminase-like domain-containing protein [Lacunisphaera sp.]